MDALPPRHVEALLAQVLGFDDERLATHLGVPLEAVRTLLEVAHDKLAAAALAAARANALTPDTLLLDDGAPA